ncbi:hypothetical protein NOMA109596_10810 [Nocardioides marinus]|uniref:Uncharacterized protein n=1 Tax=Nocardioides marinus TaxID=374514 RepID=A0A7Y9YD63_9ACTN|nr:hypothetical protein [Nocardioides marinus]NYI08807.1 hypothetical protein [Nocardioides marinus]
MIDQRTPGIDPPPSLDEILSHPERIGRVDFTHRLVPEPATEPEPEQLDPADEQAPGAAPDSRQSGDEQPHDEQHHDVQPDDEGPATGEPVDPFSGPAADEPSAADAADALPRVPTILPVVSDLADEVPVLAEPDPPAEATPLAGPDALPSPPTLASVPEHAAAPDGDVDRDDSGGEDLAPTGRWEDLPDHVHHHDDPEEADVLELSEPVTALLSLVPAEDAAVVAEDVNDVVAGVIGRIREVRSATIAHLEAIEVESALRCEMLTAQAELDAELIRLHARREAHAIIAASRHRAGLPARSSTDEQRLAELHAAATRLSEELEALGVRPGSPDHPFSR